MNQSFGELFKNEYFVKCKWPRVIKVLNIKIVYYTFLLINSPWVWASAIRRDNIWNIFMLYSTFEPFVFED